MSEMSEMCAADTFLCAPRRGHKSPRLEAQKRPEESTRLPEAP